VKEVKSCGLIVFRREPELQFLLMKHPNRWDLPKGHLDPGETELECARRELLEETGIAIDDVELDDQFRHVTQYLVRDKRFPNETVSKTLVIFLGWLRRSVSVNPSEHSGYDWFRWSPPHRIQNQTIDPLLADVEQYFLQLGLADRSMDRRFHI
jgi:8-oxo-dGTP pyrophosphatase MutT (NUDIX family)